MVCKVRPNGMIECPVADVREVADEMQPVLLAMIHTLFGNNWSPAKLRLCFNMLWRVAETTLPDQNIDRRADEILGSIDALLEMTADIPPAATEPASILLFNYSTLPAVGLKAWMYDLRGQDGVDALNAMFDGTSEH